MSTSAGSKKSRKDFGFASNVEASLNTQREEVSKEEVKTIEKQPTIDEQATAQITETHVNETTTNDVVASEPIEEKAEKQGTEQQKKGRGQEKNNDDIDKLLSLSSNSHGVQKSVYLDDDIYRFIKDKAEKNKAKFSVVLNLMLRKYIDNQK